MKAFFPTTDPAGQRYLEEIERQIAALQEPRLTIKGWAGLETSIPLGWAKCDGTLGTPDMTALPGIWIMKL